MWFRGCPRRLGILSQAWLSMGLIRVAIQMARTWQMIRDSVNNSTKRTRRSNSFAVNATRPAESSNANSTVGAGSSRVTPNWSPNATATKPNSPSFTTASATSKQHLATPATPPQPAPQSLLSRAQRRRLEREQQRHRKA